MKLHTMTLAEATAAELMMANPISLRASASLAEATKLFREKGISAAPVIDSAGHPIGVVSRSDLLIHQSVSNEGKSHSYYDDADVARREGSDEEAESSLAGHKAIVHPERGYCPRAPRAGCERERSVAGNDVP